MALGGGLVVGFFLLVCFCFFGFFSFKADVFPDKVSVFMKHLFSRKKERKKIILDLSH